MKKLLLKYRFRQKKVLFFFQQKCMLLPYDVNFLLLPKDAQRKVLQGGKSQIWKTILWSTKKVENKHLKSPFEWKKAFFLIFLLAAKEVTFFPIITKICTRRSSLSVWESNSKSNSSNYNKSKKTKVWSLVFRKKS